MDLPETRYAKTADGVHIAYQVLGEGPVDLVLMSGSSGNVEIMWEFPTEAKFFRDLASFSRLILHDRRGTGLSDRTAPIPNLETRAQDLLAVLDAVGSKEAVICGARQQVPSPRSSARPTDSCRIRTFVRVDARRPSGAPTFTSLKPAHGS